MSFVFVYNKERKKTLVAQLTYLYILLAVQGHGHNGDDEIKIATDRLAIV
jgi:hypothetical protein